MSENQGVEIPKTMLILKSQASALGAVELFLRNRGWRIYSTANLKEAMVQIVTSKPSYVLISVDHPNKKVRALPKILAQALPVATIVFAENPSTASYKVLNETQSEYRVFPPVTGPAIERCVNKYLKDQQTRLMVDNSNETFKNEKSAGAGGDAISVRGSNGSDRIEISGAGGPGADDNTQRLFAQFLNEDSGSVVQSEATKVDNHQIFAKAVDDEDNDGAQTQNAPGLGHNFLQKGTDGKITGVVPPTSEGADWGSAQGQKPTGASGFVPQSGGDSGGHGAITSGNGNSPEGRAVDEGAQAGELQAKSDPESQPEGLGSREYRRQQSAAAWEPMRQEPEPAPLPPGDDRVFYREEEETLIVRGTQKSLEESVDRGDGVIHEKTEATTSAACIVVESSRFSGYLVAVMGKNRKIDQEFIDSIKRKLFKFLEENGEDVSNHDSMEVKIRQVDFEPWALDYAEFLRKSVHKGNEVAMAFFPRRPIHTILEESEHQDMAKIQLKELQGDRQLEFDLYVYLPNNNKYILYTPKGGVFYNKQMDRLKKQGVTHMHVQKAAVTDVSKYQAQNYLNDMIEDHEKKQGTASEGPLPSTKVRKAA